MLATFFADAAAVSIQFVLWHQNNPPAAKYNFLFQSQKRISANQICLIDI
jgi:hypothetical protein